MAQLEIVIFAIDGDEQLDDLCRKYWATGLGGAFSYKVADLAELFGVKSNDVGRMVKQNSEALVSGHRCGSCDGAFSVRTRSEYATFLKSPPEQCEDCALQVAQAKLSAEQTLEANKRSTIGDRFQVDDEPGAVIDFESLSIRQAFTLATLFEGDEQEYGERTQPLDSRSTALTSTRQHEVRLVSELEKSGLLRIHPDTPVGAFVWEEGSDEYSGQYYPSRASFCLPGDGSLSSRVDRFFEAFRGVLPRASWPPHWVDAFPEFWLELCLGECEIYLVHQLRVRRLDFTPGDKTRDTFRRGLQRFTLGQMYYFIWRAARGAADFYTRGQVSKSQAANSAVTRLSGEIDRAYAEGWNVSTYRRDSSLPASALWDLLMLRSLNLSDPMAYSPISRPMTVLGLNWSAIDSETFERLIFQLVDEATDYEQAQWLMRTNAPDHGRDVSAIRITRDSLSGHRQMRVVVQCKHWLSRSIRDEDIAKEVVSIEHWQDPPFQVMIMATSGRFTADAVTWTERHNSKGARPHIELWNEAHLESLLVERQHLILDFSLR